MSECCSECSLSGFKCRVRWESVLNVKIREEGSWIGVLIWLLFAILVFACTVRLNAHLLYMYCTYHIQSYPHLLSQKHIKYVEYCGCFQGLTQFSHCLHLKWVSVTKAACIWADLNRARRQSEGCWSQINLRRDYRGWRSRHLVADYDGGYRLPSPMSSVKGWGRPRFGPILQNGGS